jgi:hypothetical protein
MRVRVCVCVSLLCASVLGTNHQQRARHSLLFAASMSCDCTPAPFPPPPHTHQKQVDLQPQSALTLSGAWAGAAGWDGWGVSGSSSSTVRQLVEDALDRVRWWAEQSDSIQGGRQLHARAHVGVVATRVQPRASVSFGSLATVCGVRVCAHHNGAHIRNAQQACSC